MQVINSYLRVTNLVGEKIVVVVIMSKMLHGEFKEIQHFNFEYFLQL